MENPATALKQKYKYAADYGFILAGYIAVFFILEYLFPQNGFISVLNYVGFLCTPIVGYILAKRYRDKGCGGFVRYGQVWSFGMLLFVFASLIMSVLYYVRFQFLQPDFIAESFSQTIQLLEQMKYPQESIDAMINFGAPSAFQITLTYLWLYLMGGAFIFLIISPFIARKKPEDTPPSNDDTSYEPYQDNSNSKE
jgi:hypothetical protein